MATGGLEPSKVEPTLNFAPARLVALTTRVGFHPRTKRKADQGLRFWRLCRRRQSQPHGQTERLGSPGFKDSTVLAEDPDRPHTDKIVFIILCISPQAEPRPAGGIGWKPSRPWSLTPTAPCATSQGRRRCSRNYAFDDWFSLVRRRYVRVH